MAKGYFGSIMWQKWTRAELELTGSPKQPTWRLVSKANDAESIDLSLQFDPKRSPAFTVSAERTADQVAKQRERSAHTLNRNARIAAYVQSECMSLSYRDAGAKVAARFGGSADTHASKMKLYRELDLRESA